LPLECQLCGLGKDFPKEKMHIGETEASCFVIFDTPGGYVGNTRLKNVPV
jgi:hypothetical protein